LRERRVRLLGGGHLVACLPTPASSICGNEELFGEHGADQTDDRGAVGEDADDVGAAADLFVQPFWGLLDQICRYICLGKVVNASRSARAVSRWSATFGSF
jgi:hypothetical protein